MWQFSPRIRVVGIGRQMVQALLDRLPVWRVMLVADQDVLGFYRRLGFESYPGVMARLDPERLSDAHPKASSPPT